MSGGVATITGYTGTGGAIAIPSTLGGYATVAIGDYAFYNCASLTSVNIPSSVTSIGEYAFSSCTSLTSITFLGLAPTTIGANWILDTPVGIRGHAYAASNFPAPGGVWNGLTMGEVISISPASDSTMLILVAVIAIAVVLVVVLFVLRKRKGKK